MKVQTIIERAAAEGLVVTLSEVGNIRMRGGQDVVDRWQPLLKHHKEELVNLLLSKGPDGMAHATRPTPKSATGLPCGGCGSNRYIRVVNGYTFPDGSQVDGWRCGDPTCGVKLLTGNPEVDQMHTKPAPEKSVALSR